MEFTHFDQEGNAQMVDISEKAVTNRLAIAEGFISFSPTVTKAILTSQVKKGDVLSLAQIAAIMGAKETSRLIPLCHPLPLAKVSVECLLEAEENRARIIGTVKTTGRTGVEMEALTAVQIGLLTIYDMCKAIDKTMTIGPVYLVRKEGGKSGLFERATAIAPAD